MKSSIPDKYLNTNVRAMISGGLLESESKELEEPEEPRKKPILYLNKLISCFKKKYRLEVSIIKEDS
tara:strand:+ start:1544 stop:1744 length:201 start_codon:yes stop_codon:yes gene_type:complete